VKTTTVNWIIPLITSCVYSPKAPDEQGYTFSELESEKKRLLLAKYTMRVGRSRKLQEQLGLPNQWFSAVWLEKAWFRKGTYSFSPGYRVDPQRAQLVGKVAPGCASLLEKGQIIVKVEGESFYVYGMLRAVSDPISSQSDTLRAIIYQAGRKNGPLDSLFFVKAADTVPH